MEKTTTNNRILRISRVFRISLALLALVSAGVLIATPKDALAVTQCIGQGQSQVTRQGPFTTKLETGRGAKVKFNVTLGGSSSITAQADIVAADIDRMRMYALLYRSGNYVTFTRSEEDSAEAGATRDYTIDLPASAGIDYDGLAFTYSPEGAKDFDACSL